MAAGDTVVCGLHSVAQIVIRVRGRDVTIWLPFFRCKQRAFDVWCVFGLWVHHDGGAPSCLEHVETTVSYLPLAFLFHDLLLFTDIIRHDPSYQDKDVQ